MKKRLSMICIMLCVLAGCVADTDTFFLTGGKAFHDLMYGAMVRGPAAGRENEVRISDDDTAARDLLGGKAEIALLGVLPEDAENQLLTQPVGKNALVFVVPESHPLEGLTSEQVRGIASGEIDNWMQLGFKDVPITFAFLQENVNGEILLRELVFDGKPEKKSKLADPISVIHSLARTFYDIGNSDDRTIMIGIDYASFQNYGVLSSPDVKMLLVDGVPPTQQTIAAGTYPYVHTFYAAIRADTADDSDARKLYEWLGGDIGQAWIGKGRFIPLDGYCYPRVNGSTACELLMLLVLKEKFGLVDEAAEIYVEVSGTYESYWELRSGTADLLLMYERAEHKDSVLEDKRKPVGKDALVFFVNEQNPVDGLTSQQVFDIYTGKITNWSQLGGTNERIRAFQRNWSSGSQTLLRKLVLKGVEPIEPIEEEEINAMSPIVEIVDFDGGSDALGFSVYYFIKEMNEYGYIKLLSIDGVYPTKETIASGEYPYVSPFYVVIREDTLQDSATMQLYDWLSSPEGQAAVRASGHVPYEP